MPNPSSTDATRQVVQALFEAVGSGDRDGALALVGETVDWGGAGDQTIPWIGPRRTRGEVGEFLDLLAENLKTETFDVQTLIADGRDAVMIAHVAQRLTRNGRLFESDIAFHLTVVDGQVVRYRYFEDSLALAEAYRAL